MYCGLFRSTKKWRIIKDGLLFLGVLFKSAIVSQD